MSNWSITPSAPGGALTLEVTAPNEITKVGIPGASVKFDDLDPSVQTSIKNDLGSGNVPGDDDMVIIVYSTQSSGTDAVTFSGLEVGSETFNSSEETDVIFAVYEMNSSYECTLRKSNRLKGKLTKPSGGSGGPLEY